MTKRIAKKLTAFLLVFSLILIQFSVSFSVSAANFPAYAEITSQSKIYSQPGYIDSKNHDGRLDKEKPSDYITTLTKGEKVKALALESDGDGDMWYKIEYGTNYANTGYALKKTIKLLGNYVQDDRFEAWLTEQKFPESYKIKLRDLHSLYPNWIFYADKIDLEWSDIIAAESKVGIKLVENSKPDSWKSLEPGAYDAETGWKVFDSDRWVAASKMVVEYYTDPRNFLDSESIFMFSSHSYDEKYDTKENLMLMLKGTFLDAKLPDNESLTYADAIMNAANASKVSPFAIASTILQEQGSDSRGALISGTQPGFEGIYNFFNVGASGKGNDAIHNGLTYAAGSGEYLRPWNTREKSITGGAKWYATDYVSIGQNTYYYMDFDVIPEGGLYNHQYATSIYDALGKATFLAKSYSAVMDSSLVFHIPVYNNMPEITRLPEETGNNNNFLEYLTVKNHTVMGFNKNDTTNTSELIVRYPVETIEIVAVASSEHATVEGAGVKQLNVGHNDFEIVVTASSGEKRVYKLSVARLSENETDALPPISEPTISNNYKTDEFLTGVGFSISVEDFKKKLDVQNGTATVCDKNGKTKTSGVIGTGDSVRIYDNDGIEKQRFSIIIYGDASGDGVINGADLAMVKMKILEKYELSGVYYKAANVSKTGALNPSDLAMVKMTILNKYTIEQ